MAKKRSNKTPKKGSPPAKTADVSVPQGSFQLLKNNVSTITLILMLVPIVWGFIEYHKNSRLQIYLAKKQIHNPIYYQLDLSLREFYIPTSLFLVNKGRSPDPYECIVESKILCTSLYQIKPIDKELYQQVEDFLLKWAAIPMRVWQHQTYPENWPNPNINDQQYLEYGKEMEDEFSSLREKIAERITIKEQ